MSCEINFVERLWDDVAGFVRAFPLAQSCGSCSDLQLSLRSHSRTELRIRTKRLMFNLNVSVPVTENTLKPHNNNKCEALNIVPIASNQYSNIITLDIPWIGRPCSCFEQCLSDPR